MAYTANITTQISAATDIGQVYNYLRPNAFRFEIKEIPHVSYSCQSANLPGLTLGFALQQTPFIDIPRIGDKLQYGEFTIRFLIAENMENYRELYDWIVAIGFTNDYNQFSTYTTQRKSRFPFTKDGVFSEQMAYSDASLTILNSVNVPTTRIHFKDLFPTSVEALDFDISTATVEYFVGIASFKYKNFDIEVL